MRILSLLLFLSASGIHLYASCPPVRSKLRAATKCLLIPLLIVWYLFSCADPSPYIVAGLFFGFVGDVFLLFPHRTVAFGIGLFSFAAGHIVYGLYFSRFFQPIPPLSVVYACIVAIVYLFYIAYLFRILFPRLPKLFVAPVLFYMAVLSFMSFSAFLAYASTGQPMLLVAYIGTVLFIVSDSVLSLDTFHRRIDMARVIVMSTYIPAQLLIAVSAASFGGF